MLFSSHVFVFIQQGPRTVSQYCVTIVRELQSPREVRSCYGPWHRLCWHRNEGESATLLRPTLPPPCLYKGIFEKKFQENKKRNSTIGTLKFKTWHFVSTRNEKSRKH